MPRINRVRLHNIRYDKGNRLFDNLILSLGGLNSLLVLHNGGGKTLLLQLIAQVVLPNASLQGRRLASLVQETSFTGHVLVEWLLDGERKWYLLTGFCFAENLGNANREMDYFTYLMEYGEPNPWDLESLPLVGEDNRTLNYRQLRERLNASGRVRLYASDRRREYQRELQSYQIDPGEWERVLATNSVEGGVGKFFEACSRTPQLLERLLIPSLDSVLGRTADEHDALTQAFHQAAGELMRLPDLEAKHRALGELAERFPRLHAALERVKETSSGAKDADGNRRSLLATLHRGLPLLVVEAGDLKKKQDAIQAQQEEATFQLRSLGVEEQRRNLGGLQEDLAAAEKINNEAQKAYRRADETYRLRLGWQYWEKRLLKVENLRREQEQQRLAMQGREAVEQEAEVLRVKVWPLHQALTRDCQAEAQACQGNLRQLVRDLQTAQDEKTEAERRVHEAQVARSRLEGAGGVFNRNRDKFYQELALAGLKVAPGPPGPASTALERALSAAAEALSDHGQNKASLREELELGQARLNNLRAKEGELGETHRQIAGRREEWRHDREDLKEKLALAGLGGLDPEGDSLVLAAELGRRRGQGEMEMVALELERHRLEERRLLFSGEGGPLPNADIRRLQVALREQGVESATGTAFLQELASDQERESWVARFPWLPFALIAEEAQLVRLLSRGPELQLEMAVAVPVAIRGRLSKANQGEPIIHFFRHQGMEPYVYPGQVAAALHELDSQHGELELQLAEKRDQLSTLHRVETALKAWIAAYSYRHETEWEQAIARAKDTLEQTKREAGQTGAEIALLNKKIKEVEDTEAQAARRVETLKGLRKRLKEYRTEWAEEAERQKQLASLAREEVALKELITVLYRRQTSLQEEKVSCEEQLHFIKARLERMQGDFAEMFSPLYAGPSAPESQPEGDLDAPYASLAGELKAKLAALARESADLRNSEGRIREYARDIEDCEGEIVNTGFSMAEIRDSFRPVTIEELADCRLARQDREQQLRQVESKRQAALSATERAQGALTLLTEQVFQAHDRPPAELPGIDLQERERELAAQRETLTAAAIGIERRITFLSQLQISYQAAGEDLDLEIVSAGEEAIPWDAEREREFLQRDLEAPRSAVRQANQEFKRCQRDLEQGFAGWRQVIENCRQELATLNNHDINRFFHQLLAKTELPGWEKDTALVFESLAHVKRVIIDTRTEVERRLADANRVMEEMVDRSHRQAAGILDELKTLQARSRVDLRGAGVSLVNIDFRRPDPNEGRERIRKHLVQAIEDATNQRQSGQGDDEIRIGLTATVRSATLVRQLVPLEEIRFSVLKPRSDDLPYQGADYRPWDDLINWSEGQRYAARFSVFVVLMSFLRQRRNPKQKNSVIIADNPFGGASSGHILEIVMTGARQTGAQLFCVTAHRQTEIMREFSVLYSLVHRPTLSGQWRLAARDESSTVTGRVGVEPARAFVPGAEQHEWSEDLGGQLRFF